MKAIQNIVEILTRPADGIPENEKQQAQLLSLIILVLMLIGTVVFIVSIPNNLATQKLIIGRVIGYLYTLTFMFAAYLLSRTKYIRVTVFTTVFLFDLAVILTVMSNIDANNLGIISFLLIPILLASFFLSWRITLGILFLQVVILIFTPNLLSKFRAAEAWEKGRFGFLIFMTVLMPVAAYQRNLLEKRRQSELERLVTERTAELKALQSANFALTKSLDLDQVLETFLNCLNELVDYDSANVMLLSPQKKLSIRASRGYDKFYDPLPDLSYEIDLCHVPLLNQILESHKSVLVPDTAQDSDWVNSLIGGQHVRSWFGLPILFGGDVIGIYSLDKAAPDWFDKDDVRKAAALSAQAAVAIQNALNVKQIKNNQAQLRKLTHQVVVVEEAERRRLSRELHDEAGQGLTALKFILVAAQKDRENAGEKLQEAIMLLDETSQRVRAIAHDLRPTALDDLGLNLALNSYCRDFSMRTGLPIYYSGTEAPIVPDAIGITLSRILQEGLTNVVKHAQASQIMVDLICTEDTITLSIEDNGCGFETFENFPNTRGYDFGIGLQGMKERLEAIDGNFDIDSSLGQGTCITAVVPLKSL